MKTQVEIIQILFKIHRDNIPRIYHADFEKLGDLDPGMNGTAIQMVLENLNVINEGRILVVSGPVGCGKTFSAFILALWREWINLIEPDYQKITAENEDYYADEFIDNNIDDGDFETRAFKLAILNYYNWVRNRNRFRFDRAIEVIELGFDIKSLRNFSNLVIIDDLGRDYFTDKGFGISRWDGFIDLRYSELLPTLITTNMTPQELTEKYNFRIYDRLKQIAEWITINEKSLRGNN